MLGSENICFIVYKKNKNSSKTSFKLYNLQLCKNINEFIVCKNIKFVLPIFFIWYKESHSKSQFNHV